jgi:hypothetical protein
MHESQRGVYTKQERPAFLRGLFVIVTSSASSSLHRRYVGPSFTVYRLTRAPGPVPISAGLPARAPAAALPPSSGLYRTRMPLSLSDATTSAGARGLGVDEAVLACLAA